MHFFYLFRASVWTALAFLRANWWLGRRAILALRLPFGDALTNKDLRRLQHYYYGTTYLSVVFCALRGRWRSEAEKQLFTNLSALAYFFDDLAEAFEAQKFERKTGAAGDLLLFEFAEKTDARGLAVHFLKNVYSSLPPRSGEQFQAFMHRVFEAETEGRKRVEKSAQLIDIQRVTAEKGGCSVLMFRRLLAHELDEKEAAAIFDFGHLMQLSDDIFDLWQDQKEGIVTAATARPEADFLAEIFEKQWAATVASFRATGFSKTQKETALRAILGIVAVTRVCLGHYQKLEKAAPDGRLPLADRKKMVCDMERWPNRLRAAWGCFFSFF